MNETARRPSPVVDALFFATLFTVTFAKLQWEVAGTLSLSDVLTALFLVAVAGSRLGTGDRRIAYGAAVAAVFFLGFLLVYLVGFFNLETDQELAQWAKGMVKFVLHFLFLVAGISYISRRGERFYWRSLAVFMGGIAANAAYGVVQLGAAEVADVNLDQSVVQPLTGGASQINIYGAIGGQSVYRPNALTGDPNHLGIELIIPLLVLTPLYLRLERGHRLRWPLAGLLAFLLLVELATLSRSGLLGLGAGAARARDSVSPEADLARAARAARGGGGHDRRRARRTLGLLRAGAEDADRHLGERGRRRISTSTASSRTSSPRTPSSGSA